MSDQNNHDSSEKVLSSESLVAFIFAFITVQLYFISPIYFIFKYNKRYIQKKHIPFLQILFNLLDCTAYVVIYITGKGGDFQNVITNSIGLVLCLIVILQLYFALSKTKDSKNNLFHFIFIFNIIFQIYYFFFKYISDSSKYLTIIINICMYLSLNTGTYYAFKEGKPDRIPILSAVLGLITSICWTAYSKFIDKEEKSDTITFYSNIISFSVIIFTIVCYIYLICKKPKKNEVIQVNENDINNNKDIDNNESNQLKEKTDDNNDD